MRFATILLCLLVVAALLALRGNEQVADDPAILHRALIADVGTLDPHRATSTPDYTLAADLFAGLVGFGRQGEPRPLLAEAWTVDMNGTRYRFRLRPNLRWSDGRPLRAVEIVASFRRALTPATAAPYAYYLYAIRNAAAVNAGRLPPTALGVSAPNGATIEFRLERPAADFVPLLAMPVAAVMPAARFGAGDSQWIQPGSFVGSGPYLLASRRPLAALSVRRNPHFAVPEGVGPRGVDYAVIETQAMAITRFRGGDIDVVEDLPERQLTWLRDRFPGAVRIDPLRGLYYLNVNLNVPRLRDHRVREALSLAIDREVLVDRVLRAGDRPAYTLVPPSVTGYTSCGRIPGHGIPHAARLARARALLREAGYGPRRPLSLELRYNASDSYRRFSVVVARMWADAGIETRLLSSDNRVHFSELEAGNYEIGRAGWSSDVDDPFMFFYLVEGSSASNDSNYNNPDYDRLVARAMSAPERETRARLFCQAEAMALRDLPIIPVYFPSKKSLVSTRTTGWPENGRFARDSRFITPRPEPQARTASAHPIR